MSDKHELNSWRAAAGIMEKWRQCFMLPNYTPRRWWECDVFELTNAGYFVEYEIKMTVSDYRRDAKKEQVPFATWGSMHGKTPPRGTRKHDLLEQGSPLGPCRFHFVTPPGLLKVEELPEWAGLLEMYHVSLYNIWRPSVIRKAPQLHNTKFSDEDAAHARGICYYRMHEAYRRNRA